MEIITQIIELIKEQFSLSQIIITISATSTGLITLILRFWVLDLWAFLRFKLNKFIDVNSKVTVHIYYRGSYTGRIVNVSVKRITIDCDDKLIYLNTRKFMKDDWVVHKED